MYKICITSLLLLTTGAACDPGLDTQPLRERLETEIDNAEILLDEAIAAAEAEVPGATTIEAALDVENGMTVYDVELYLHGSEYEVYVSPADGSILRVEHEALDADDAGQAQRAAALVVASAGWTTLIATAESATGGIAFDVEADGDDGLLEVDTLAAEIREVELDTGGNVVKQEVSDDDGIDDDDVDDDADDD